MSTGHSVITKTTLGCTVIEVVSGMRERERERERERDLPLVFCEPLMILKQKFFCSSINCGLPKGKCNARHCRGIPNSLLDYSLRRWVWSNGCQCRLQTTRIFTCKGASSRPVWEIAEIHPHSFYQLLRRWDGHFGLPTRNRILLLLQLRLSSMYSLRHQPGWVFQASS